MSRYAIRMRLQEIFNVYKSTMRIQCMRQIYFILFAFRLSPGARRRKWCINGRMEKFGCQRKKMSKKTATIPRINLNKIFFFLVRPFERVLFMISTNKSPKSPANIKLKQMQSFGLHKNESMLNFCWDSSAAGSRWFVCSSVCTMHGQRSKMLVDETREKAKWKQRRTNGTTNLKRKWKAENLLVARPSWPFVYVFIFRCSPYQPHKSRICAAHTPEWNGKKKRD